MTCLTWKNSPWNFDKKCKLAFLSLQQAFTTAPVLTHYKPDCSLVIETNASNYVLATILSQVEPDGDIHLITYLSQMPNSTMIHMTKNLWLSMKHLKLGDITLREQMYKLMWSQTTKTWNISVLLRFYPGDKSNGLLPCLDSICSLDFGQAISEQNQILSQDANLYTKEEGKSYGTVNLQNCHPVFPSTQLSTSLCATRNVEGGPRNIGMCAELAVTCRKLRKY